MSNQRKLIADFLKGKDEFVVYDTYVDDGFTGLSFQRPSFMRMMDDIEDGNVNCVIVKDLSRFGRDYIETGRYLERYFPDNDVRFIAITDNIDSMKQSYDILLPIKNIFNEQYARDISKKVHASMKTKQKAGEFIGAFASYGYRKSPTDKNKLVIDDYAANVVRRIFQMYISGYGKIRIAGVLNKEGIECPSEYKKLNGENYCNSHKLESTSYWTYSTVNRILKNEMYIGNMVQGRKTQRMKGRQRSVDKEDWIIVEHTHESIIDPETWQKAQELLKRRTRELDLHSNVSVFAGFLKCGDCGRSLVKKRRKPRPWKRHHPLLLRYLCEVRQRVLYTSRNPLFHP
ncbi:MAG: recombinase family protein [Lachnospiraceae bacterium]|nr:recombinase family protein [Lachnospiraceae bacterium]